MQIDIITIFPEIFDVLDVSLLGKARSNGLLTIDVHNLRDWAHDRHRTVDDTPYGGGAGMVMKPEPWGEAIDAVTGRGTHPLIIFTTPAGAVFHQHTAHEWATREHLIFCLGRYEGIDERVMTYAATRGDVALASIGDYVLNGGEVAALVMIEAVARLIPGFIGNAHSLDEESHAHGLLEYPIYTKPAQWRDYAVPAVLLSGDHGKIASWRHEQAVQRTRERRPDLLTD